MADARPDRLQTAVAIVIGVISILGAVFAGLAASADSAASDFQRAGLNAALNYEKARASAQSRAFQNLQAAAEARSFNALAARLEQEAQAARERDDERAAHALEAEARSHRAAAEAALLFVEESYLDENGAFDDQRYFADQLAFTLNLRDLDYDPADDFRRADDSARRSAAFVLFIIVLSLAVLLLTLVRLLPARLRVFLFGLAALIAACGLCSPLAFRVLGVFGFR